MTAVSYGTGQIAPMKDPGLIPGVSPWKPIETGVRGELRSLSAQDHKGSRYLLPM
jgi:hypothetical protein